MASLGSQCRRVGHADIGGICPAVRLADDEIALTIPEAGFTDPVAVVQALLRVASQNGARVYEYMPAAIRVKGDSVAGVITGDAEIATKAVVVASGVWSNELLTPIGAGLPIYWHRAEVSFYRRPGDVADHPIIGDFVQRFYFRPEQGGLTMAGSIPVMSTGVAAPTGLERIPHPDSMVDGVKAETMRSLLDKLTVRIPRFQAGYWRRGHACVYDVTPDWHPVFSYEHNTRGLFVAAGFSGHGFVMSPAAGRLTAEAVAGVHDSRADVYPFRPQRFVEEQPVSFAIG
jgi:sarcosine oxidase subunit beta